MAARPSSPVLFALASLATALLLALHGWHATIANGFDDPDSLMRIVEVRDFLAGQGWYDLLQPRLFPPDGVFMHWSRLVDAPIAGLILALEPTLGPAEAERLAVNLWPPLLVVPFLAGLAAIAHRFAGWTGAFWVIPLFLVSPSVGGIFLPGRVDHHNVQAILIAWMVAGLVRAAGGWRAGALAGFMAGLSLAIGMEVIHAVAIAAAGLSLAWVFDGRRYRSAATGFGVAFALSTAALFFATVGPDRWSALACDALSPVYLVSAGISGLGLAAVASLLRGEPGDGRAGMLIRGGALAAVGAFVIWIAALYFPLCLGGPYAGVDPALQPIWLDLTTEAQNIFIVWSNDPTTVPILFGPPVLACVVAAVVGRKLARSDRIGFACLIGLIAACLAVGTFQIRGTVPAQSLAVALGAAAVGLVWQRHRGETGLLAVLKRSIWLPLAPIAWFFLLLPWIDETADRRTAEYADFGTCRVELGETLSAEPPGKVAATVMLGAFLLFRTEHSVYAAPYHRGGEGIIAMEEILTAPAGPDRTLLSRLGATYLAVCRADRANPPVTKKAPDGLLARVLNGAAPAWLLPLRVTDSILVYRIDGADPSVRIDALSVTGTPGRLGLRPSL
ncbi:hypothetical protein [Chthonobacter albigriseus]|uniref:hypothetical protein n=1 Tax=Chthonobacter albigriseus TaxID=1683161 RepID=UPI0015EF3EF1|nr:hypothetical protein [Chthonobacter albigriseus]